MTNDPWLKTSIMTKRGLAKGQAGKRHELSIARQGAFHYVYGPYAKPVLTIDPGDVVMVETEDAFGGVITSEKDSPTAKLKFPFLNPQCGPIAVNGKVAQGQMGAGHGGVDRPGGEVGAADKFDGRGVRTGALERDELDGAEAQARDHVGALRQKHDAAAGTAGRRDGRLSGGRVVGGAVARRAVVADVEHQAALGHQRGQAGHRGAGSGAGQVAGQLHRAFAAAGGVGHNGRRIDVGLGGGVAGARRRGHDRSGGKSLGPHAH